MVVFRKQQILWHKVVFSSYFLALFHNIVSQRLPHGIYCLSILESLYGIVDSWLLCLEQKKKGEFRGILKNYFNHSLQLKYVNQGFSGIPTNLEHVSTVKRCQRVGPLFMWKFRIEICVQLNLSVLSEVIDSYPFQTDIKD